MKLFIVDPNITYAKKVIPRDKAPLYTQPVDDTMIYDGSIIPQNSVTPQPFVDTVNMPGYFNIGGIILPPDTKITPMEGKKELVHTTILDGPPVFEHIETMATKIELEFTLRMQVQNGQTFYNTNTPPAGLTGPISNIFAQQYLHDVWFSIFKPNSVLTVINTMLNNLNISQLVIENCIVATVHGSTNIPCKIMAWENVPGQSLIITS